MLTSAAAREISLSMHARECADQGSCPSNNAWEVSGKVWHSTFVTTADCYVLHVIADGNQDVRKSLAQ